MALALFLLMLALFFGRATWGRLADLLPLHEGLLFHRFIGGVHLGAILLLGLGGEWVWRQGAALPERWRALAAGLVLLALLVPALRQRQGTYARNGQRMELTRKALDADEDARTVLAALRELPPGRAYAGLRANWGRGLTVGGLHFYHLLLFHRIPAVQPPHQNLSLNSHLLVHFDDRNPAHYDLFNVKYVVAPSGLAMPQFLRPITTTPRYTLYRAETSGYGGFAAVAGLTSIDSQSSLYSQNPRWLLSPEATAGRFVRYEYPAAAGGSRSTADRIASPSPGRPRCPGGGVLIEERVLPGRIDLRVECRDPATLVLKVTYHPNLRITVDGRDERPFMLSPSFIGLEVPGGAHHIRAEYRSPAYKTALLLLGACALLATIWFRRRFARLDAILSSSP